MLTCASVISSRHCGGGEGEPASPAGQALVVQGGCVHWSLPQRSRNLAVIMLVHDVQSTIPTVVHQLRSPVFGAFVCVVTDAGQVRPSGAFVRACVDHMREGLGT